MDPFLPLLRPIPSGGGLEDSRMPPIRMRRSAWALLTHGLAPLQAPIANRGLTPTAEGASCTGILPGFFG
jgi:hypothetical protein